MYPYGLGKEKNIKVSYDPKETGNTHASDNGNLEIQVKRIDSFDMNKLIILK